MKGGEEEGIEGIFVYGREVKETEGREKQKEEYVKGEERDEKRGTVF